MKKFTFYIATLSLVLGLAVSSTEASNPSLMVTDATSQSVMVKASYPAYPNKVINLVITDTVSKIEVSSKDVTTSFEGSASVLFTGLEANGHYTAGARVRNSSISVGPYLDIVPFSTPFNLLILNTNIKLAKDKLSGTVEGEKVGQYKNGSKGLLQQAITEADLINASPDSFASAKQADVDKMVTKLQKAMADFDASKILSSSGTGTNPGGGTGTNPGGGTGTNPGGGTGTNPGGGTGTNPGGNGTIGIGGIENPLGKNGPQDIPAFIELLLNIVLVVGVPLVTLAIIYAGFLFVTAQGNTEKLGDAKKVLLYTIIGATLLLGSFVIARAIKGTVDEIKKTS